MFEHEARLKYVDSVVEVYLKNPCPLKAVRDIAEAFYIEFGTPSDKVKLETANGYFRLIFPVFGSEETPPEQEEQESTEKASETESEYHERILNTALEVLSENNGLTPVELQQELAKKGVVATPVLIGRLLNESGKAQRLGFKWYLKRSEGDGWKQITDKIFYRIDDDNVSIGYKRDDKIETLKIIPLNLLKDLYDLLDDEATSEDINALAVSVGIGTLSNLETYIMRILANEFSGELQRVGRSLVLVKGDEE